MKTPAFNQRPRKTPSIPAATAALAALLAMPANRSLGQTRAESLELPGGQRTAGRLTGDARTGFGFIPADGSAPRSLEPGSVVHCNGAGPDSLANTPPFRVLIGEALRLSGSLRGISPKAVRLDVSWQSGEVTLSRPGAQAVIQRTGEARVLVDGFEALDATRWSISGKPVLVEDPHLSGRRSLRLPAGGASLVHRLEDPLVAGRFDLAFLDDGSVVAGQQWSIELTCHGPSGASVWRVVLGWSEESLAVESPSGPTLAVQRLARTPGWHRFSLKFGPDQTEISVDGKELAHGKGPEGPLTAVRLASSAGAPGSKPPGSSPAPPAGHIDDLQLIRFAEPPASLELDVAQDEVRSIVGDQLYGVLARADGERLIMTAQDEAVSLPWSEVSGVYFRRLPAAGTPVEGLLVRAQWRSAPGDDPDNLDFAEGALTSLSDTAVTLATPYSGTLTIPRGHLRALFVLGHGRRLVIDPAAHHLGDEMSTRAPALDPPQPEGDLLLRTIELAENPSRAALLVLDVVQVVGENNDEQWSPRVRAGELRTYILVNGQRVDYLNRYIKTKNMEASERVAIPIPVGLLRAGKNTVGLQLTPTNDESRRLDDQGVLQIALEFPSAPRRDVQPGQPGPP
jgi:hypothetical protein